MLAAESAALVCSPDITDFSRSRNRLVRAAALIIVFFATNLFAQDPGKDPDSFDIEPPLLIPNRGEEPLRDAKATTSASRDVDLAKLEKEFERAKRNSASLDRLLKIGALSKLEVEQRRLRVVHLEFDLANARLLAAKEQARSPRPRLRLRKAIWRSRLKLRMPQLRSANKPRSMRLRQTFIARRNFSRSEARGKKMSTVQSKS